MKKLILLFTLLLMSSSAFAWTYQLKSQRFDVRTNIRTCYYDGGHVLTRRGFISSCPRTIQR